MRLRTTAVALAGALAFTLPAGAQAFADDGQAFNYAFLKDGERQSAQLSDLAEDKCHQLTATDGAVEEIANDTDKVALLFDNATCTGEPVTAVGPGEKADEMKAVAVVFEQAQSTDEARMPADTADDDPFDRIFSSVG